MDPGATLSQNELDHQEAEMLPARETLFFDITVAPVVGVNLAFAINAATIGSSANAYAAQGLGSLNLGG
ncbi:hypothetical protein [Georgenia sp. SYP-B2076]|uniref:hypothetical protein n=1 Tax=Georgenia sp. SYP-B2076 TaxID=2495881 RepID=UPI000F8E5055|nr:hypothetical protein [Georgenia sp. SYP-B2076]